MKKLLCLLLAALICAMGMNAPFALSEVTTDQCPDLAICEGLVWHIDDMALLCENAETGAVRATLPLSELYEAGQTPFRVALAAWTEHSVLLLLGLRDASDACAMRLLELGLTADTIAVVKTYDAANALAFLADNGAEWYEVNMVACQQRLVIAAMDSAYQFHFYAYAPDADALVPLVERSLACYTAALPYGDDMLIVGPGEADDSMLELTRLSLEDGSTALLESVALDSAVRASNFAWDASQGLLYYTVNNTVYTLAPNSGEAPKAVGTLPAAPAELRLGALVGNRFVALDEGGRLLSCDVNAPVALSAQLRIANVAGDAAVADAARNFGVIHPGCTVSMADNVEDADILPDIESPSPQYDAYVLTLNSGLWRQFQQAGLPADLSADETLSAAVADMTGRMQAAIQSDGRLWAMPLAVGSSCQMLNVPALEALTGLSRDELPTDWSGFLALLGQLADSGALGDGSQYSLTDMGLPAEGLREMLLSWLLQDCQLWHQAESGHIDSLPEALTPVFQTFNEVDWSRLGAPDAAGASAGDMLDPNTAMYDAYGSGQTPLMTDGLLDITVAPQIEGMALWPLSIQPGGPRLVGQVASVICVNARSANVEAALAFVAHAWEMAPIEARTALCQSTNEVAENAAYQEDMDYMAQDITMLQQAVASAQSADERDYLQAELDQLLAYMEDYRANGRWLISEESIALYRAYADALVPIAPELDYDGPLGGIVDQFLNGGITPGQFAERLPEVVQ